MRYLIPCLLATGAILAGTAAAPARAQNDAMAACKAVAGAYEAATRSGDPAKVAAVFPANGVLTAPEGIFQGTQAIAAYEAEGIKPGVSDVDTFKTARMLGNDVVVCSGGYTFTSPPGGPANEVKGTWTKVLAKSGSKWQLQQLTYNYAPPPAEPQPQQQSQAQPH